MKDLAVRLAALDADAGAALRVIAYFDTLTESRAGLQAIVRGAAVLAGCPARLDDLSRRVHVRVDPAGHAAPTPSPPDASWMRTAVVPDGSATLWLERTGEPGPVEAMILERAAGAARVVLDRTRGRAPAQDPSLLELLVDPEAPADARQQAARRLGLEPTGLYHAVALPSGPAVLPQRAAHPPGRAGIGPAVRPPDLPSSYTAARVALRFAADGTAEDPGPTVVRHEELGGLALLAEVPGTAEVPDVQALDHAAATAPWALATLHAFAEAPSLRTAATALRLHHSTLQDRIGQAEHLLGWPLRDPHGRLRLQIAPILGRSSAAVKMLASRARRRVRAAEAAGHRPSRQREVVEAFLAASRDGDFVALLDLLDPDVTARADATAAPDETLRLLRGADVVARQALAFSHRAPHARVGLVDGAPAILVEPAGRLVTVMTFTIAAGRIVTIDITADPERLAALAGGR